LEHLRISASVYTGKGKKAVKIAHLAVNMPAKVGQIEVFSARSGGNMGTGRRGKKQVKRKTTDDGGKKQPPAAIEDEEEEDGDIATPKRDRTGEDDQPL
jgi:hypothetical protein